MLLCSAFDSPAGRDSDDRTAEAVKGYAAIGQGGHDEEYPVLDTVARLAHHYSDAAEESASGGDNQATAQICGQCPAVELEREGADCVQGGCRRGANTGRRYL